VHQQVAEKGRIENARIEERDRQKGFDHSSPKAWSCAASSASASRRLARFSAL
jgi:hypothetical protein